MGHEQVGEPEPARVRGPAGLLRDELLAQQHPGREDAAAVRRRRIRARRAGPPQPPADQEHRSAADKEQLIDLVFLYSNTIEYYLFWTLLAVTIS